MSFARLIQFNKEITHLITKSTAKSVESDEMVFDEPSPSGTRPATGTDVDLLDPSRFKLNQTFDQSQVPSFTKVVPVQKPGKKTFIRVHPDRAFQFEACLLEMDKVYYLIEPGLVAEIPEAAPYLVYTYANRDSDIFLWPIRVPGPDGKSNAWWDSAAELAALARQQWLKIRANQAVGAYEYDAPEGDLPHPEWPTDPRAIFRTAFRKYHLANLDHFIIQRLRGRI